MGGFPTIRHNEIRDIAASLLTEVCNNVATEPPLQPLSGESMTARSANIYDGACTDVRARGFWNASQDAFFDVRVFYPNASSNRSTDLSPVYRRHEQAKKREYGEQTREERGVFTPLVLSKTGSMGREASTFRPDCSEETTPISNHDVFEAADTFFTVLSMGQTSPWQHLRDGSPQLNFLQKLLLI